MCVTKIQKYANKLNGVPRIEACRHVHSHDNICEVFIPISKSQTLINMLMLCKHLLSVPENRWNLSISRLRSKAPKKRLNNRPLSINTETIIYWLVEIVVISISR